MKVMDGPPVVSLNTEITGCVAYVCVKGMSMEVRDLRNLKGPIYSTVATEPMWRTMRVELSLQVPLPVNAIWDQVPVAIPRHGNNLHTT